MVSLGERDAGVRDAEPGQPGAARLAPDPPASQLADELAHGAEGSAMSDYAAFLARKTQAGALAGFAPLWMPDFLFDFQVPLVDWAIRKGRAALFADCGLGKTPMQLVWAENVARKTGRPVLILTPLAVGAQTVEEGRKFGIAVERARHGAHTGRIVVSNYEMLHRFDPSAFGGVVCDESSILKHFSGATQQAVTRFMAKTPYRLLCTATAAPNDYVELGTASEALGELGYSDMLTRFFRQTDTQPHRMEEIKLQKAEKLRRGGGEYFAKLAFRAVQNMSPWRLKGHAVTPFWRWVASWARACRSPRDLGYDTPGFTLPPLTEQDHVIEPQRPRDGMLFTLPAFGLGEEREERRRTLEERCALVASLVRHDKAAVVWCHLNAEGDRLAAMIPDAKQVRGADSDDAKEDAYRAFAIGDLRVLITKPKIGAWGLNWQHCAHVVTFASHSYEQFYQSVRRCWRFGQAAPVTVDIVMTTGERHVRENMRRKADLADAMFTALVRQMSDALHIERATRDEPVALEMPAWLTSTPL